METIVMSKKDEIIMKLVHYFVTVQNYTPIVVNGVKDEIWLENNNAKYRIIRINSNYIHNKEQYEFDINKTNSIVRQIKKKTFSFKVNTLNIFLDVNDNISLPNQKNIDNIIIAQEKDITKKTGLAAIFPDIKKFLITSADSLEFVVNVTKDINTKTEKENKKYDDIFKPKKIIVTNILIGLNIFFFVLAFITNYFNIDILTLFANNRYYVVERFQLYRLFTSVFLHANIVHLLVNMYALKVVGSQIEQFLGKTKLIIIYLISGIGGSLLSITINNAYSLGASGAIFGLLGSLLYFGYHYRIYLGNVLKSQLIPLIIFNLALGFIIPGIDNAAHIGGLICGLLCTMSLKIPNKDTKSDQINGIIVLIIFITFLSYLLFAK